MRGLKFLFKKTFLVFFLAAVFTVANVMPAFAINLKFTDITASKYNWARPYIEKMYAAGIIKGVTETSYAPDSAVTRAQIITMIVRLLGLEQEAKGKQLPATFANAASVPQWAREYVAEAVEKGIISGKDLDDFRPVDDAKRYEVAVFAVKALGLGEEAQNRKNVNLSFSDTYAIPLDARAYVEIAVEKGIVKGFPEDNSFRPNDKITRVQAATLLHNLAKQVAAYNVISGEVQDVDTLLLPSITIKLSNGNFTTYTVNNSTSVYKEDEKGSLIKASLNDVKIGGNIRIIPDSSSSIALYVEITSGQTPETSGGTLIEGTITDIDSIRQVLTVKKSGGLDMMLGIKAATKIYVDGKSAVLSDLAVGQPVTLLVSGADLIKIEAKNVEKQVKGILRYIDASSKLLVILNEENDERESYTINAGAVATKDGKKADLSDIRSDDMATITIAGSKVVKIDAESAEKQVAGVINSISFLSKNPVITVKDKDGDEEDYELNEDVDIRKNGKSADINDLKKGDEVTVTLEYNKVVGITAKSVKKDVSGTIKTLIFSDTPAAITIADEDGGEQTFSITPDTEIVKDRKQITVYDLRVGDYVDMEVESDEAISIDVTTREVKIPVQGIVQYIHSKAEVIVLTVKNTDGTKETTKEIHYTDDTEFRKGSSKVSVRSIDEGDEILAIGTYDGGLFFADTIIDLTISR